MLDQSLFEKLEAIARSVRGDQRPFGGIQLILCGDFLQLPPVNGTFVFHSAVWWKCVDAMVILEKVHRQTDARFLSYVFVVTDRRPSSLTFALALFRVRWRWRVFSVLSELREGRCSVEARELLCRSSKRFAARRMVGESIEPTILTSKRDDVQRNNEDRLRTLPGESRRFTAVDKNAAGVDLDKCTALPKVIDLKIGYMPHPFLCCGCAIRHSAVSFLPSAVWLAWWLGRAQVVYLKNDSKNRLVNGSRGIVRSFTADGAPSVQFEGHSVALPVHPTLSIVEEDGKAIASRTAIPLALAWVRMPHRTHARGWLALAVNGTNGMNAMSESV
jgi:ATP-dependent DNA helicase PIF1